MQEEIDLGDIVKGKDWALILGASSGFGAATAIELSKAGFNIFGAHLDMRSKMPMVQEVIDQIKANGVEAEFFNVNVADPEKRAMIIDTIKNKLGATPESGPDAPQVRVLMHSLAFGTLKPYIAPTLKERLSQAQMDMTLNVMAHSLVYWAQDLVENNLMRKGGRIYAMTSSGSTRVIANYGLVSAAKAALESHIRQLAYELAPRGITANSICAGVTMTAALDKIPGKEYIIATGQQKNPSGRLTTTQDIAKAITLLTDPKADWITGNVIRVDGGEEIVA
jgi:NAD(P)-dependent dehydrogenase (short-subunit alcohol dehydrogenase family)